MTVKHKAMSVVSLACGMAMLAPAAHADSPPNTVDLKQVADQGFWNWIGGDGIIPAGAPRLRDGWITFSNTAATQVGNPTVQQAGTWYIGTAELNNHGDNPQTLSSQSFTKQIQQTLSTSTTNGMKVTASASTQISACVELVSVSNTFTVTGEVDFSKTTTTTTIDGQTFTAPPQNIVVPAHSSATVNVTLQKVNAVGTMALTSDLGGQSPIGASLADLLGPNMSIGGLPKLGAPPLPAGLTVDVPNQVVHFNGAANYTATMGTNMIIDVSFHPLSGETRSMAQAKLPTSYQYKITPEPSASSS